MIDLRAELAREAHEFEGALEAALEFGLETAAPRLVEAMRYSLLDGGKRLRPVLCLWVHDATGRARDSAVTQAAVALEMIHSYSLVHDDLPSMDDDDLRRGKPSCHRQFDEATAILAGDTLQTEAFGLLARVHPASLGAALVVTLARAAGATGMASGQQLDLDAAHGGGDREDVVRIHRLKTGKLLGAASAMGALCGGLDESMVERIGGAGEELGVAFQMIDDVLDETVSATQLGKSVGKDAAQGKLTAVTRLGIEGARTEASRRVKAARATLADCGVLDERVDALIDLLVERDR